MNQKQGLLLSGQSTMQGINQQYTLQSATNASLAKQGMNASKVDAIKFGDTPTIQNVTLAIKNAYNPNVDYATQRAAAGSEVDKFLAANPDIKATDKEAYLDAWHDLWRSKISNATDAQMNADTKAKALAQFDGAKGLRENVQTSEDTGVTDYAKESEMYTAENKSAVQAKYDALKAAQPATPEATLADTNAQPKLVTAKEKFASATSSLQESIDSDNEKIDALKMEKANAKVDKLTGISDFELQGKARKLRMLKNRVEANKGKMEVLDESQFKDDLPNRAQEAILAAKSMTDDDKLKAILEVKTDTFEKKYLEELLNDVKTGGYVSFADRFSQHTLGNERLWKEVAGSKEVFNAKNGAKYAEEIAGKRRSELFDWIGKLRNTQDIGITEDGADLDPAKKLAVERMLEQRIAGIDNRIANPTKVAPTTPEQAIARANEVSTGETAPTKPVSTAEANLEAGVNEAGRTDTGIKIGTLTTAQEITWQEKKSKMSDWFQAKYGYVPSSFDKVFADSHPESKLATAKTAVGDMWYDGDKWHLVPAKKEMSRADIEDARKRFVGKVDPQTGAISPQEMSPKSGIYLRGNVSGDQIDKFKEEYTNAASAIVLIDQAIALNEKSGAKLIPWDKAQGKSYAESLKAAVRPAMFPGARATEWEQHILNDIVPTVTDVTTIPKSNLIKLNALKSKMLDHLKQQAANRDVQFHYKPTGAGNEMQSKEAALKIKLAQSGRVTNSN